MNDKKKMVGNKGEWSELYTFFKLLADGKIYAANEKVEKIDSVYYPILKIFRQEYTDKVDYIISDKNINIILHTDLVKTVPRKLLEEQSIKLFNEILKNNGSFNLDEISEFSNDILVTKIKAPSSDTTDISLEIEDIYTNLTRTVGFSIKSEVGSAPTLLNAGQTTNFIYKVTGISKDKMSEINSIGTNTKIKDRIQAILNLGGSFKYYDANHKGFKRNLIMIDSSMPEIVGNLLLIHYLTDVKDCNSLINLLYEKDPLDFKDKDIYEYKIKKLLCSCALGMKPAKQWDGLDEANGGYIIVKSDGEVLAYHIYNRNFFEQYLLNNTMLERASTSRHQYMSLYEEDGNIYIMLNLQIRFKK